MRILMRSRLKAVRQVGWRSLLLLIVMRSSSLCLAAGKQKQKQKTPSTPTSPVQLLEKRPRRLPKLPSAVRGFEKLPPFDPSIRFIEIGGGRGGGGVPKPRIRQKTAFDYHRVAEQHIIDGQFKKAIAALENAIRLKPNYPEAHFHLGCVSAEQAEELKQPRGYQKAISALQQALRHKPKYAEAHYYLAAVYTRLRKPAPALTHFKKALGFKRNPKERFYDFDLAQTYEYVASLHVIRGELREAIRALNEALKRYRGEDHLGGIASTLTELGRLYRITGDYRKATASFQELARGDSRSAFAHYSLGVIYAEQKDHEKAAGEFRKATEIDPEWPEAHYNRAVALLELSQYQEALQSLNQALALKPKYPEALYNLGIAYHRLVDHENVRKVEALLETMDSTLARELRQEINARQ